MFVKFFQGLSKVNLLFMILSSIYILAIFFLSDSPVTSNLSHFNPQSLLHIPLYGILTLLLYLSFNSAKSKSSNQQKLRFLLYFPIIISIVVAILDEVHQIYIPSREASIWDIFLDFVGIGLTAFILLNYLKKKKIRFNL